MKVQIVTYSKSMQKAHSRGKIKNKILIHS